jgi:uncharacterized protein (TIGR03437 family)
MPTNPLATNFNGTSVLVADSQGNSLLGGLYYISPEQIDVQLPADLALGPAKLYVQNNGLTSQPLALTIKSVKPNYVEYARSTAAFYLAVLHRDGSLVTGASPATAGEIVSLYAIGLGSTNPSVPTGQAAVAPLAGKVDITVNGFPANVLYAGLQGVYPGLYQVNVTIPQSVPSASSFVITTTAQDGTTQTDTFSVETQQ